MGFEWAKEWFQRLQQIIRVELKDISILSNLNIHIGNKSGEKSQLSPDNKKLEINFSELTEEDLEKLRPLLREFFEKNEADFLEKKAKERVDDIKIKFETTQDILRFYKGKISEFHFEILESCMYLKRVHDGGGDIEDLKQQIVNRFGEIGKNMANLGSSGYFEGFILKYYDEISKQSDFSKEKFRDWFEEIVKTIPFTVFVHQLMDEEYLISEIKMKLQKFLKYGANFLAIHGLGKTNVVKILTIIQKLKEEMKNFDYIPEIMPKELNIIVVKIMLKRTAS